MLEMVPTRLDTGTGRRGRRGRRAQATVRTFLFPLFLLVFTVPSGSAVRLSRTLEMVEHGTCALGVEAATQTLFFFSCDETANVTAVSIGSGMDTPVTFTPFEYRELYSRRESREEYQYEQEIGGPPPVSLDGPVVFTAFYAFLEDCPFDSQQACDDLEDVCSGPMVLDATRVSPECEAAVNEYCSENPEDRGCCEEDEIRCPQGHCALSRSHCCEADRGCFMVLASEYGTVQLVAISTTPFNLTQPLKEPRRGSLEQGQELGLELGLGSYDPGAWDHTRTGHTCPERPDSPPETWYFMVIMGGWAGSGNVRTGIAGPPYFFPMEGMEIQLRQTRQSAYGIMMLASDPRYISVMSISPPYMLTRFPLSEETHGSITTALGSPEVCVTSTTYWGVDDGPSRGVLYQVYFEPTEYFYYVCRYGKRSPFRSRRSPEPNEAAHKDNSPPEQEHAREHKDEHKHEHGSRRGEEYESLVLPSGVLCGALAHPLSAFGRMAILGLRGAQLAFVSVSHYYGMDLVELVDLNVIDMDVGDPISITMDNYHTFAFVVAAGNKTDAIILRVDITSEPPSVEFVGHVSSQPDVQPYPSRKTRSAPPPPPPQPQQQPQQPQQQQPPPPQQQQQRQRQQPVPDVRPEPRDKSSKQKREDPVCSYLDFENVVTPTPAPMCFDSQFNPEVHSSMCIYWDRYEANPEIVYIDPDEFVPWIGGMVYKGPYQVPPDYNPWTFHISFWPPVEYLEFFLGTKEAGGLGFEEAYTVTAYDTYGNIVLEYQGDFFGFPTFSIGYVTFQGSVEAHISYMTISLHYIPVEPEEGMFILLDSMHWCTTQGPGPTETGEPTDTGEPSPSVTPSVSSTPSVSASASPSPWPTPAWSLSHPTNRGHPVLRTCCGDTMVYIAPISYNSSKAVEIDMRPELEIQASFDVDAVGLRTTPYTPGLTIKMLDTLAVPFSYDTRIAIMLSNSSVLILNTTMQTFERMPAYIIPVPQAGQGNVTVEVLTLDMGVTDLVAFVDVTGYDMGWYTPEGGASAPFCMSMTVIGEYIVVLRLEPDPIEMFRTQERLLSVSVEDTLVDCINVTLSVVFSEKESFCPLCASRFMGDACEDLDRSADPFAQEDLGVVLSKPLLTFCPGDEMSQTVTVTAPQLSPHPACAENCTVLPCDVRYIMATSKREGIVASKVLLSVQEQKTTSVMADTGFVHQRVAGLLELELPPVSTVTINLVLSEPGRAFVQPSAFLFLSEDTQLTRTFEMRLLSAGSLQVTTEEVTGEYSPADPFLMEIDFADCGSYFTEETCLEDACSWCGGLVNRCQAVGTCPVCGNALIEEAGFEQCEAEIPGGAIGVCCDPVVCTFLSFGTPCENNAICDGAGSCVECGELPHGQCQSPCYWCAPQDVCRSATEDCCGDGIKGPTETCELVDGELAPCCDDVVCRERPSTHVCRPPLSECDIQETCTGFAGVFSCPFDRVQNFGTPCGPGGRLVCNGRGGRISDCIFPSPTPTSTTSASPIPPSSTPTPSVEPWCGNGVLDTFLGEECDRLMPDGSWPPCCNSETCRLMPAGTVCRPLAGACDVEEYCSGGSMLCPDDVFQPSGVVCRPVINTFCDIVEVCTGLYPECPDDLFRARGTFCGNERSCDGYGHCKENPVCTCLYDQECGDDGCGTSCGVCPPDRSHCNEDYFLCVYTLPISDNGGGPMEALTTVRLDGSEYRVSVTLSVSSGRTEADEALTYRRAVSRANDVSPTHHGPGGRLYVGLTFVISKPGTGIERQDAIVPVFSVKVNADQLVSDSSRPSLWFYESSTNQWRDPTTMCPSQFVPADEWDRETGELVTYACRIGQYALFDLRAEKQGGAERAAYGLLTSELVLLLTMVFLVCAALVL